MEAIRPALLVILKFEEWTTNSQPTDSVTTAPWAGSPLAESFGYFQNSSRNTLALIQKVGLAPRDHSGAVSPTLSPEAVDEVHRNLEQMPNRQILDILVQHFAAEVNWMEQLVQIPWFLARYESWWMVKPVTLVAGVDFAVLILRICSYTLQFLPSPGYALDTIRGVSLAEIRNLCNETADGLETISIAADARGSLIRVQYVAFSALKCRVDAKSDAFWDVLGRSIRIAQNIGLHCDTIHPKTGTDIMDQEMERRTYCNLFILDSSLSRQLDRVSSHQGRLPFALWPKLDLIRNSSGDETSDQNRTEYDIIAAEERYDRFSEEYVFQLPPIFSLKDPDVTWDKRMPKLPLQRKLLHSAINDSIYWNFRPLLLTQPVPLPVYKSLILGSQKRKLAAAALLALASVKQLHELLGSCHTRFAGIIFTTFEAAALLVFIYTDPSFEENCPTQYLLPPGTLRADPLQATLSHTTRSGCMQAVQGALKRLKMLAEVSSMADVAATTLSELLNKASEARPDTGTSSDESGLETNLSNGVAGTTSAHAPAAPAPPTSTTSETAATSQVGPTFTTSGNEAPWLSADMPDMGSLNNLVAMSEPLAVGDFAGWLPYDASNLYAHQSWVPDESPDNYSL
ncbi:hypothetical protein HBH56_243880 [Parastagonospora nodorum]|uniref:Transcription factor domain-containing protein n=1 Tax=Phaeosphaeria nodorum (strain SN15 / ATCC MYA-4574 / FGSC 10173) TaxID=321614 RepID=A0A7U2F1G9_PHANO|nr:hypothetical protein HBH56_243880 [Parastagonospora nodorum]QRC96971.1 hypothetical protein JI435_164930 [Parastagonospora nodorum SN15]KAH3924093.1 hypothetical protein HBH54_198420 [Parastagonospora nodorum]KAH3944528.1 hypothetical protein HBH53_154930 [Parastagonospora nodorum]KAH3956554.1 hypothetical protein HBH51_239360 [Parastagonospora nodorum]